MLAELAFKHRLLMAALLLANFGAALFEGGTMALLVVAVAVLVKNETIGDLVSRLGPLSEYLEWVEFDASPGGLFLILIVIAVTAQMVKAVLSYAARYCSIQLIFRVAREVQESITHHIMSFTLTEIERHPAGVMQTIIQRGADFAGLVSLFNRLILALFMFTIYLVLMFSLSSALALSAFGIAILLGIAFASIVKKLKSLGEQAIKAALDNGRVTVEFLQAHRLLRVFNTTEYAEKKINTTRFFLLQAMTRAQLSRALVDPTTDVLTVLSAGMFLGIGYLVSGEAAIDVIPKLLLFLVMLNRMMPQVKALNECRMSLSNALPVLEVVVEFLEPSEKEYLRTGGISHRELTTGIAFKEVSFCYPDSDVNVLENIDLLIPKGTTTALVGASGAGKSTFVDLFLGLHEPTTGVIQIDGVPTSEINLSEWQKTIGSVDQEVFLLNATIAENIAFGRPEATLNEIVEAAKAAHVAEFVDTLPHKYETMLGDRGVRLSGGQKQRVALARALLREPEILLLDEATSSLDSGSEKLIQETIEDLRSYCTVLVIAHRLSTVVGADNIVFLEKGRIAERGSFADLINAKGLFFQMWSMQVDSAQNHSVT